MEPTIFKPRLKFKPPLKFFKFGHRAGEWEKGDFSIGCLFCILAYIQMDILLENSVYIKLFFFLSGLRNYKPNFPSFTFLMMAWQNIMQKLRLNLKISGPIPLTSGQNLLFCESQDQIFCRATVWFRHTLLGYFWLRDQTLISHWRSSDQKLTILNKKVRTLEHP